MTTSGQFRTAALLDTIAEVGCDRVLFSIDCPFEETAEAVMWFRSAGIDRRDQARIGADNAAQLFNLSSFRAAV